MAERSRGARRDACARLPADQLLDRVERVGDRTSSLSRRERPFLGVDESQHLVDEREQAPSRSSRCASRRRSASRSADRRRRSRGAPRTPAMALSGVRSSWLMTARNCDFARFAVSAACSRRRASWLAILRSAIVAPNNRQVDATIAMNVCRSRSPSFSTGRANGPFPSAVATIAATETQSHRGRGPALPEADRRPEQDGDEQVRLMKWRGESRERGAGCRRRSVR